MTRSLNDLIGKSELTEIDQCRRATYHLALTIEPEPLGSATTPHSE
jgi:hypothetical protein